MSDKITTRQIGELIAQSENGRITRELLQRFLENPLTKTVFERMLEACKFDWVNNNITHENFPITKEPDENTEYVLVHLDREASTEEVEAEIKNRGLKPATLADFLLYVRKNPNEQKRYPIVALGSRWRDSDGRWHSPCALYWDGQRSLDLDWREYDWLRRCRFLACKPR